MEANGLLNGAGEAIASARLPFIKPTPGRFIWSGEILSLRTFQEALALCAPLPAVFTGEANPYQAGTHAALAWCIGWVSGLKKQLMAWTGGAPSSTPASAG